MTYERGDVVKGPDVLGPHAHRPYVCLSDSAHPFSDEEAPYAATTTTRRPVAIPIPDDDFEEGGLPAESFVNPWTMTVLRHGDVAERHGIPTADAIRAIAEEAARYIGVTPASG